MYQMLFIHDQFHHPPLGFLKWKCIEFRDTYSLYYERNSFCSICITISIVLNALKLVRIKLQLQYAIYRLRFYSNSLIHILSLSNSHNDVISIQKNRDDKSHCLIVALDT